MVKRFLIPLFIAGSLASCAPSMQASAPLIVDPVFATGQIWQVTWRSDVTVNLIVPARDTTAQAESSYEGRSEDSRSDFSTVTNFKYIPGDSGQEVISVIEAVLFKKSLVRASLCVVRNPGPVEIGTSLKGAYSNSVDGDMEAYIKTGVSTLPPCYLKRLK